MWLVTRIFLCSIFFVVGVDCQGGGGGGGGGAYGLGNYTVYLLLCQIVSRRMT
jgi:hypothetical protein